MKVETNINIYLHGRYLHGSEKGGQLQSIVTLCVSLKRVFIKTLGNQSSSNT